MKLKKIALGLTGLALIALTIPSVFACVCPPARGKITGGGQGEVEGADGIPGGSFGFNVMWYSRDEFAKGELNYVDHTTGMNVHAHDIPWLEVWMPWPGNKPHPMLMGQFWGPCTVDGEATDASGNGYTFWVIIRDYGEPGKLDRFWISVGTNGVPFYEGGSLEEPILCGNIQIHKPPK